MRAKTIQGAVLVGAAAVLLAGCSGTRTEEAAPPPPGTGAEPVVEPADRPVPPAGTTTGRPPTRPPEPPRRPAPAPPVKRPVIGAVTTTPGLACEAGWCRLPAGSGTLTLHAEVTGATRVEFFAVPTGTGTWDLRRSLGVDRDGRDGWSVRWAYGPDDVPMAHLTVLARGPGGTAEASPINLYRE